MFYRGYVFTKDKKCIEKWKNKDLHTLKEMEGANEYAGILADDAILIDVDDMKQSKKLLKIMEQQDVRCRVYQSRSGMHFLFKNSNVTKNYTKVNLACGIVADVKCGLKNSYEVLKIEGKERVILYDILEDETYQELPKFLYPVKTSYEFSTLENGDGRNQTLFNYILTLQTNGFEREEIRETIRILNEHVLPDPLPDDEMDKILRDDAFKKDIFFEKGKFLHERFATFLRANHHIIRIDEYLHAYKDGIYVSGNRYIEHLMIQHIPNLTQSRRREVLAYIDVQIGDDKSEVAPANYIAFRNGIYNMLTNTLEPFNPSIVILNKIPWDYVEGAYNEAVDTVLNNISCGDTEIRSLLEEMTGYALYRRNELGKAFILTGGGKNGKSTFLNMVKRMLGHDNISVLDMKRLGDRFSTVMLYRKLANIGDDISDDFLSDASEFKKICTGEMIDAEQKGMPKFQFSPYVKLMFSANTLPRIGRGKDSSAVLRRLIIVPFNATFDKSNGNYDGYIIDQLSTQSAMEYMIQLAIRGLRRVLETQEFTTCQQIEKEVEEYAIQNNPVLAFFKETPAEDIVNHATHDVYARYKKFCYENGHNAVCAGELSKQVKKQYAVSIVDKRLNGRKARVFV